MVPSADQKLRDAARSQEEEDQASPPRASRLEAAPDEIIHGRDADGRAEQTDRHGHTTMHTSLPYLFNDVMSRTPRRTAASADDHQMTDYNGTMMVDALVLACCSTTITLESCCSWRRGYAVSLFRCGRSRAGTRHFRTTCITSSTRMVRSRMQGVCRVLSFGSFRARVSPEWTPWQSHKPRLQVGGS